MICALQITVISDHVVGNASSGGICSLYESDSLSIAMDCNVACRSSIGEPNMLPAGSRLPVAEYREGRVGEMIGDEYETTKTRRHERGPRTCEFVAEELPRSEKLSAGHF